MKNRIFNTALIALTGLFAINIAQAAAAPLSKADAGEFVLIDGKTNKESNVRFRFTPKDNYWITDVFQDGKWKKFVCDEQQIDYCKFTASTQKTKLRLFSSDKNIVKGLQDKNGLSASCVDSKDYAFCRLNDSKKGVYLLVVSASNNPKLMLLKKTK